jgi:Pyridoxamine 5'-phosphate oxidase
MIKRFIFSMHALAFRFLLSGGIAAHEDEKNSDSATCPCRIMDRPDLWKKEHVARWMVHTIHWGVLSTISSRLPPSDRGDRVDSSAALSVPFGNVYSFVDGSCDKSSGVPYFYGTYMDQTFRDIRANPSASLTLSEASIASVCGADEYSKRDGGLLAACQVSSHHGRYGDPESPICARLTLTGTLVVVDPETSAEEHDMALQALYQRHPQMSKWPVDHDWVIAKLEIQDVWFIDYFGGASVLSVNDYMAVDLFAPKDVEDAH